MHWFINCIIRPRFWNWVFLCGLLWSHTLICRLRLNIRACFSSLWGSLHFNGKSAEMLAADSWELASFNLCSPPCTGSFTGKQRGHGPGSQLAEGGQMPRNSKAKLCWTSPARNLPYNSYFRQKRERKHFHGSGKKNSFLRAYYMLQAAVFRN